MISAKEKVMGRRSLRLKRIKRAADEKKAARLKQLEIFISQWPVLAIIN